MPRLWTQTVEAHRRSVHQAILDVTAGLVAEQGLRGVTMSRIAEETGIGRATLYKYFPDVEAILVAWHERQVGRHLEQLIELRDGFDDPSERLRAVLEALASHLHERVQHGEHRSELAALVHRDQHMARAQQKVHGFIRELLDECAQVGDIRRDVPVDELASYCLYALQASSTVTSEGAVERLVGVTLAGLRPAPS